MITPGLREKILVDFPNDRPYHYHFGVSNHGLQVRIAKILTSPATGKMKKINFSNTLRCIGQDLIRRDFKIFDICIEGDRYVVRGGYTAPTATFPVAIYYTVTDIKQLDSAGQEKRGKLPPAEDFVNLEQVLRTFGGYVDKIEARLIRLTNSEPRGNGHSYRLEYETADGDYKVEEHSTATAYEMCVAMYKLRGRMTGTNGMFRR